MLRVLKFPADYILRSVHEATLQKIKSEAFDEGREFVNGEIVCSVCGLNHDRDESAACEGCEPIRFDEWIEQTQVELVNLREALEEIVRDYHCIIAEPDPDAGQHLDGCVGCFARTKLANLQTKEQS